MFVFCLTFFIICLTFMFLSFPFSFLFLIYYWVIKMECDRVQNSNAVQQERFGEYLSSVCPWSPCVFHETWLSWSFREKCKYKASMKSKGRDLDFFQLEYGNHTVQISSWIFSPMGFCLFYSFWAFKLASAYLRFPFFKAITRKD